MTNPTYPGTRPATVSVSTYLLWATAAIVLIQSVLTLTTVSQMSEVYSDLYQGTPMEGTESIVVASSVGGVVIYVLVAAGLAILSIFNNRGRNGARITTWVLGGLMLCCGGFGLLGTAASGPLSQLESSGNTGGPTTQELQSALDNALPSWYQPLTTTLNIVWVLAILGVVILLALPASNAFFRRPARGFDPSVPYAGYPGGQPPYPQYPGAPQQPQQPQYPTYPAGPYAPGQPPPPAAQQPQYPPAQPPAQPPPPAQPSSDPWSRSEDEQRPPTDPTSQP
ncbi:hypothetical protein [Actinoplanes sp. NBRC 103695]|uniref:hypothetical protein n=1 Tax=Actinoplanes sp. NBRC 103695 TaxID=3032202 RepID=UPI002553B4A7|nr:hypothetical protein [Actinoplanes sp. NBRC 103695]GLY99279.1 hypothetical protein Acsp02_65320 [Actinoplanes sp. NBRC 103695]